MKIGLYNLISDVHNEEYVNSTLQGFLAASLEIASFLKQKGKRVEIIHGSSEYIATRMKELRKIFQVKNKLVSSKLGVIGKPSDWLIASEVDDKKIKDTLGISLIDVEMDELLKEIDQDHNFPHPKLKDIREKGFNKESIDGELKIYNGFKAIVNKYKLDGITVRCFDLLDIYKNTGCLGISLLNAEGIVAGCEGDISALLSMVILHYLTDEPVFMANPSSIDLDKNEIILAHCTLPLNMPDEFYLKTHFESGLGVGIKGNINEGEATIFKLSGDGKNYFVSGGEIIENLNKECLCRTQIRLKINEDVKYFLQNSIGNHHLICKGDYSYLVKEFFKW